MLTGDCRQVDRCLLLPSFQVQFIGLELPVPTSSLQRWEFYFESEQPDESEQAYIDWTINTLIPEDTALYENVQHGLRSQGYSQGRFVINRNRPEWSEHHVHQFQTLVRDAIMADC